MEWVLFENKLPENDQLIIVSTKEGDVLFGEYEYDEEYSSNMVYVSDSIRLSCGEYRYCSAWMPLPNGYKA